MSTYDLLWFRDEARRKGLTFPLDYYTDEGWRTVQVFLIHHRDPQDECYTAHLDQDGTWLAVGDTKEEAETGAALRLYDRDSRGVELGRLR